MKKIIALLLCMAALSALFGCTKENSADIKITVVGDDFYPGFKEGIERAQRDFNSEYSGSGFSLECVFSGGEGYEDGTAIIDVLASDETVTAVVGAGSTELNKTAAEVCDKNGKILVVPYFMSDGVYKENNYDYVFSMCNSGEYIGETLRGAADASGKKRWAVCAADDGSKQDKLRGFIHSDKSDGIEIADCLNISSLQNDFDAVYKRWETLGVEGVIMFPEIDDCFETVKKLKQRNPALLCGGDDEFDDSELLDSDAELKQAMTGFIIAGDYNLTDLSDEEESRIKEMAKEAGGVLDSWYIQGYNAVRMIADTAVQNQTTKPEEIAVKLHENGYRGLWQEFKFAETGEQAETEYLIYSVVDAEGFIKDYKLER